MSTVRVNVFKESNLRSGGRAAPPRPNEPDNVMFRIPPGEYEAYYQYPGPEAQEGDDRNFWWIRIRAGQETGWISAICISTGGNDQPIPGVPTRPAVYGPDTP